MLCKHCIHAVFESAFYNESMSAFYNETGSAFYNESGSVFYKESESGSNPCFIWIALKPKINPYQISLQKNFPIDLELCVRSQKSACFVV